MALDSQVQTSCHAHLVNERRPASSQSESGAKGAKMKSTPKSSKVYKFALPTEGIEQVARSNIPQKAGGCRCYSGVR